MKLKNLFFVLLILMATSCGDDVDDIVDSALECTDFVEVFNIETRDLENITTLYTSDPSKENCEDYKDALYGYNELLRNNLDCWHVIGQFSQVGRDSIIRLLDFQKVEIDNIDCK